MTFIVRISLACWVDALRNVGAKSLAQSLNEYQRSLR